MKSEGCALNEGSVVERMKALLVERVERIKASCRGLSHALMSERADAVKTGYPLQVQQVRCRGAGQAAQHVQVAGSPNSMELKLLPCL